MWYYLQMLGTLSCSSLYVMPNRCWSLHVSFLFCRRLVELNTDCINWTSQTREVLGVVEKLSHPYFLACQLALVRPAAACQYDRGPDLPSLCQWWGPKSGQLAAGSFLSSSSCVLLADSPPSPASCPWSDKAKASSPLPYPTPHLCWPLKLTHSSGFSCWPHVHTLF